MDPHKTLQARNYVQLVLQLRQRLSSLLSAAKGRAGRPGTGSRALPFASVSDFHARSARRPAHSRVGEWTLIKGPKMKRPNVTSDQQLKRAGSRLT